MLLKTGAVLFAEYSLTGMPACNHCVQKDMTGYQATCPAAPGLMIMVDGQIVACYCSVSYIKERHGLLCTMQQAPETLAGGTGLTCQRSICCLSMRCRLAFSAFIMDCRPSRKPPPTRTFVHGTVKNLVPTTRG